MAIRNFQNLASRRSIEFINFRRNYSRNWRNCDFCPTNWDSFIFLVFIRRFWLHGKSYFLDGQILTTVWFKRKKYCSARFGNSLCHSCNYEYQKHRKRKRETHHDSDYTFYDVFCKTSGLQYYYCAYFYRWNFLWRKI